MKSRTSAIAYSIVHGDGRTSDGLKGDLAGKSMQLAMCKKDKVCAN